MGEVEHGDFTTTEGQSETKARGVVPGGDPHCSGKLDEITNTERVEEFDRGNVIRASERGFEGNGAVEVAIVVFGTVIGGTGLAKTDRGVLNRTTGSEASHKR